MSAEADQAVMWRQMEASYADSPIHRALGLSLVVKGAGEVEISYSGAPAAANRRGNAAGGALAEMIDSAVVQASKTLIGPADKVATLELKVNFVRPGPPNASLTTRAKVDYIGRSTCVGTGHVFDAAGELIALGIVTVNIRREKAAG